MRAILSSCLVVLLLAPVVAGAQTYRCVTPGGSYFSDRPCGGRGSAGPSMGVIGPTARASPSTVLPATPRAEEHLKYLSVECAQLSEGIRNGPGRGLRSDGVAALRVEYARKCGHEDAEARQQLHDDARRVAEARASDREQLLARRQQADVEGAQCLGMRDAVALRRKREAQLNPREVEGLRELERSYNARCLSR